MNCSNPLTVNPKYVRDGSARREPVVVFSEGVGNITLPQGEDHDSTDGCGNT